MKELYQQSQDQTYIRSTLLVVSFLALVGTGILTLSALLTGLNTLSTLGLFAGVIISAITLVLTWRGYLKWPGYILPPIGLVIVTYLVYVGEGIHDEAILGYALAIAFAGFLLGKKWSTIYTFGSVAIISFIGFGQLGGWLPITTEATTYLTRILATDILLLFLGGLIYVIIQSLEQVVQQVKNREAELAQTNQTLQVIQSELEERITERVQHINQARQEAEDAKQAVEQQAWQTNGLAKLGDVTQGNLTIVELSHNVIQLLCQFLEVQVGAVFLVREDRLELMGSYAYTTSQPDTFEFGEGLVGQAALDQQIILLSDMPAENIRITTALGEIVPNQVIAAPFLFEKETIGVIVLGKIHTFTNREQQFLQRAAESIGVVFHTVQTREQIEQLLQQSQAQAAELQASEEELRSLNEELESQAENMRLINLELQRTQQKSQKRPGATETDVPQS